jgi:hypothetical protein
MQKKRIFTMLLLVLIFLVVPKQVFSQYDWSFRDLRGFDSLFVLVYPLDSDLEQAGLTRKQIETDVEIKLRKAGFKVNDNKEPGDNRPALEIKVRSLLNSNGLFTYSIQTSLSQKVILHRDNSVNGLNATTWTENALGTVGRDNVRSIRDTVSDHVDKFFNDYLKGNAIKTPSDEESDKIFQIIHIKKYGDCKPNPLAKYAEKISPKKVQKPLGKSIQKPLPKPVQKDSPFTATYVGGNSPPTIEIFNDTNRTMYFDFGQGKMTAYTIPSGGSQKINLSEAGSYKYKASAPRVRSDEGQETFNNGYLYTWRFYIVTVPK